MRTPLVYAPFSTDSTLLANIAPPQCSIARTVVVKQNNTSVAYFKCSNDNKPCPVQGSCGVSADRMPESQTGKLKDACGGFAQFQIQNEYE